MRSITDEKLMLAFKAGDVRAFEELVGRHRTPVYNFILRMVRQRQRAEDLLQESLLKVVRGASTYEAKAKFTTWLYTMARNLCMDEIRKESYRRADSLEASASGDCDDQRSLSQMISADDAAPDRSAFNRATQPVLESSLARLPVEQREVFMLREYHGMQFKEIAETVGISENTAKSRMRYALLALRKNLIAAGIEGDMTDGTAHERSFG